MAKKKKTQSPSRETFRKIFPKEIADEVDRVIEEVDSDVPRFKNPTKKGARSIKPWSKRWVERQP
jgi:hypothetical protein